MRSKCTCARHACVVYRTVFCVLFWPRRLSQLGRILAVVVSDVAPGKLNFVERQPGGKTKTGRGASIFCPRTGAPEKIMLWGRNGWERGRYDRSAEGFQQSQGIVETWRRRYAPSSADCENETHTYLKGEVEQVRNTWHAVRSHRGLGCPPLHATRGFGDACEATFLELLKNTSGKRHGSVITRTGFCRGCRMQPALTLK